ncbi:uncharacterized protein PGTG_00934 [Puccinia graminis f. sp. tritici CRL 75-36-700-3]|uniref:Calcium-transporting ATPase n=1 Tax=Puccinia graminis f. sp. tritici (strain CRL 75-36-700-3 / race SCCL) TaxID=418459 RepID=E3JU78_PUCGT|nr:uncharacterized protein PGTG_00934 [Puccinia graminis f. sp. tritici CRL 75-36-700-3]EFP75603.2 hypothetical protein PGTG_00934 [Puccinia graminis f. sp. tritici CRL 75-36-700-3]
MSNTEHQQPTTTTTTTTTTTSPPTSIIESRDGDTTKHNEQHIPLSPSEPHPQQSPIKPTSSSSSAAVVEQQQQQQLTTTTTTEQQQEQNGFKINTTQLTQLIDPKSIKSLSDLGGPQQLSILLQTDLDRGLNNLQETLPNRTAQFGTNILPEKPTKTIFQLIWLALQDKVLIILIIAAVISLALGLYTTLGTPPKSYTDSNGNLVTEPQVDWVEGVAILVAVAIVTLVGSVNDYQKELQFKKLNAQKEDRSIKVIRQGQEQILQIGEILVGDLLLVNAGDLLPADGIFLDGYEVKCDESSVTGESDLIKKVNYNQALQLALQKSGKPSSETLKEEVQLGKTDCFMISGSKVVEGYGRYLVTAVGPNSFYGKIMISLQGDTESTPLQTKLNSLAELIAKLGATAGLILFTALMIRFFVQLKTKADRSPSDKAQSFIQVLIISVTVVVVAVPEGLPLAVTLALAFATRRMTQMNLLVRVLSSCEIMANATVVCTDKTGTLTQNKMTIVAGSIGVHCKFAADLEQNERRVNISITDDTDSPSTHSATQTAHHNLRLDFSVDQARIQQHLTPGLIQLFNESIAINSTAFEAKTGGGQLEFIGSKTETALLSFAKEQGWPDYHQVRQGADIVQMIPFSSQRKAMGVVVRLPGSGRYRLFLKGASEVLTKLTSHYVCVRGPSSEGQPINPELEDVSSAPFDLDTRENVSRTIMFYANQSLRTIALCYRDFESWPPTLLAPGKDRKDPNTPAGEVSLDDLVDGLGLTLLAVVAIEDPLRPGVTEAVANCARAGVAVKMVTGDNIITAKSIALQCGIYTPGGIIMEGPIFRQLSKQEMLEVVPRLQVLARSSPEDKKRLVDYLKFIGETCAVTGDGTNDGPALKAAHVGFSMGISGTEVAKEASDIILMDDNFSSIVSAIMWGRCVNDSVKKFLQFQLSVNITAVLITFITSIASDSESSILTAVQLLWVNLIMDTFAALALATDPATRESLGRKPDHKGANLISLDMWKMIIGQSIYQLIVILILNFSGKKILNRDNPPDEATRIEFDDLHKTLVFNAFVFCQIFNQFNARVLDRSFNIFRGILKNYYFMVIFLIMLGGQILIVEVGGAAFQVTKIGIEDWLISVIIGLLSLPLAALIKLIPTEPIGRVVYKWGWLRDPSKLELEIVDLGNEYDDDVRIDDEAAEHLSSKWNPAIDRVRDNLALFSQIRGGRMRSSSFVKRSRKFLLREKDIHTGALMTMVPTLVVTSIGAGWQPQKQNEQGVSNLADPASTNPTASTTRLWCDQVEVHPDTDVDDPVYVKMGANRAKKGSLPPSPSSPSSPRQIRYEADETLKSP